MLGIFCDFLCSIEQDVLYKRNWDKQAFDVEIGCSVTRNLSWMFVLVIDARGWNVTHALAFVSLTVLGTSCALLSMRSLSCCPFTVTTLGTCWHGDKCWGRGPINNLPINSLSFSVRPYLGPPMCFWFSPNSIAHLPFSPAAPSCSIANPFL